jgi:hypothetical protein
LVVAMSAIGVDFDKVIHTYEHGWRDGTIYGELVPGADAALHDLMTRFAVFIFTSRDTYDVEDWLADRTDLTLVIDNAALPMGFWNRQDAILITNRKYPAVAYVDDRAIRFTDWPTARADIDHYCGR